MKRSIALAVTGVLALGACSSSGSDDESTPAETVAEASDESVTTDSGEEPSSSEAAPPATEATDTTPPTEPAPTTTEAPADPPLVESGASITIESEPGDVGSQPLMDWAPVDGAAEYRVVVRDGNGETYWAWSGPDDQVRLGGGDSADGGGPTSTEGSEWSVVAFDADGGFVASSPWVVLA